MPIYGLLRDMYSPRMLFCLLEQIGSRYTGFLERQFGRHLNMRFVP